MKRFLSLFMVVFLLICSMSMIGCGSSASKSKTVLKICNCEDYIDEDLLTEFTEETGIEVIYSTFGTNENLYNELVINPNSYDLVVPSEYMIEKLAEEGRIQKLDFSRLAEYKNNVSPFIQGRLENLEFTVKDGEYKNQTVSLDEFMVGYMWGTMGWVYNTEHVSVEDVNSWYGPFKNKSLSGEITIKDAVRDSYIVGLGMVYEEELKNATTNEQITEILNRTNKEDIDKVGAKLTSLKPMLYGFEVDSGKNDIILGNIMAYVAWSGDAAYAIDVASGDAEDEDGTVLEGDAIRNLSYYIPDEGSNIWFDGFVMPSASRNYDAAYKFLEFISRPESVYRNMNYTGYTSIVADGEFEMEDEQTGSVYSTTLFDEVVIGWFDETEYLLEEAQLDDISLVTPQIMEELEYLTVDLSYFYGEPDGSKTVIVHQDSYGRLIAQYPTLEEVSRCAIMNNFSNETLMDINDMWESVKGETFKVWVIILILAIVVLVAIFVVIYRKRDKFKWLKLPQKTSNKMIKKGYKIIKKENLIK